MSVLAPIVVSAIVDRLLKRYTTDNKFRPLSNFLLDKKDNLKLGLSHLLTFKDLLLPADLKKSQVDDQVIDDVITAIEKFQKTRGILEPDGFLGEKTLRFIETVRRCIPGAIMPVQPGGKPTRVAPDPTRRLPQEIYVFVKDVPVVRSSDGTKNKEMAVHYLKKAARAWEEVCNVDFVFGPNMKLEEADVLVDLQMLTGANSGPELARAELWPKFSPANRPLHLTFDQAETFVTPFVTNGGFNIVHVAAHELGHILGLSHYHDESKTVLSLPGELMHDTYQGVLEKPSAKDIERIQQLWGPPL